MKQKDMINDYLSMINSSLTTYASMISQTNDPQLRKQLQQMRDADEARQYQIYECAKQKGYYKPAESASQTEINKVKSELTAQA